MVITGDAQEASESQKFPLLLLTTAPTKNPPIPSLTPPSLPDCSQCASQFLITLTSSRMHLHGRGKKPPCESHHRGEVLFQLPKKHRFCARLLYHCSQKARPHIFCEHAEFISERLKGTDLWKSLV